MNAIASILAHTVGHASLHIPLSDRHLSYILFYSKFLNIVPWKQCIWRHSVLYWCIVRHTTFYLNKHCKHLAAALSWKRPKYSTFSIYIYIRMYFTEPRYMYIFQLHQYLMPLILCELSEALSVQTIDLYIYVTTHLTIYFNFDNILNHEWVTTLYLNTKHAHNFDKHPKRFY